MEGMQLWIPMSVHGAPAPPHHTTPHHTTPHSAPPCPTLCPHTPRHATPRHATPRKDTPRHSSARHSMPTWPARDGALQIVEGSQRDVISRALLGKQVLHRGSWWRWQKLVNAGQVQC